MLSAWRFQPAGLLPLSLQLQLDLMFPTGQLGPWPIPLGPYSDLQAGLAVEATPELALAVQASVHTSPIRGTGLNMLALATSYVVLGLTYRVAPSTFLELGVGENVFSFQRGADFTILLSIRTSAGEPARGGAWAR
jgi:hypothetical protein